MDAELLPARINDTEKLCEQTCTPKFLGFLTPAEAALARNILKNARARADFFGGYDGAERVMLGCFPDWAEDFPYPISPLIECIAAALCGLSRSKICELIAAGLITVNSVSVSKPTKSIAAGDVISVRGKGRYIAVSLDGRTKKDRIIIKYKKYIQEVKKC